MSKDYQQQLCLLKAKILLIGHKAESSIADATRALVERRPSLAQRVLEQNEQVDKLEAEIVNLCLELLEPGQLVASDFRFITTAMKIVEDIQRIREHGIHIAQRALETMPKPELKPIIDMPVVARAVQRLLKDSVEAFVNSDGLLAREVIAGDRYIDDVWEQMLRELLTYMLEDPSTISPALGLMSVARRLECVGEHALNIAESAIGPHQKDGGSRQAAKVRAIG
jgi:phosphate transport system protein